MRLLLHAGEYRAYGRLRDASSRAAFVERFWASRDPDPATPENEFQRRFEQRVREASERFAEPGREGWQTDRGRAWVLLGPPDETRDQVGGPENRRREIWWYHQRPGGGGALELVFERDRRGRMRLRQAPSFSEDEGLSKDTAAALLERQRLREELRKRWSMLTPVELDEMVRLFEIPPAPLNSPFPPPVAPSRLPHPRSSPRAPAGQRRLPELRRDEVYFFRASDGSVLALLSFETRLAQESDGHGLWGAAWLLPRDALRPLAVVPLEPLPLPDGRFVFGGRLYTRPGRYRLRLAFGDRERGEVLVRSRSLSVPDLDGQGLQASSIVPAERFGRADGEADPFAVGSERVVPRPSATFAPGEPLRLYLQIYGAAVDPVTGRPSVDVRFSFDHRRGSRLRRHGPPLVFRGATGTSLGLALPVGNWPPGDYIVRVRVYDRLSGRSVHREGGFTLRPDGS